MKNDTKPKTRKRVAVLTETTHAAGRNMIKGIARYVREHESWSVYYAPRALEQNAPTWLKNWDGDGIIARISSEAVMDQIRQGSIPVVDLIGGTHADKAHPSVLVSDEGIGRKAAAYFLDNGFRIFAFLGMQHEYWSTCRQVGFYGVLNEGGHTIQSLKIPSFYSSRRKTSWEQTEAVLEDWVRSLPKPCAVLCANDDLGPYLTEACRRAGLQVPDDIAVLGVDNDTLFCELCDPPLSSIDANHAEAGYQAAATLDRLMQGKKAEAATRYVPSRGIIQRASTDIIATDDDALKKACRFIQENCTRDINVDDVAATLPSRAACCSGASRLCSTKPCTTASSRKGSAPRKTCWPAPTCPFPTSPSAPASDSRSTSAPSSAAASTRPRNNTATRTVRKKARSSNYPKTQ